ncbi:MAG TPA: arylamine N-acetyltransferase, partial [Salinisphaeraceae bacterium]|nr:arylamine N-acetyltransferase [Salinisphaeraceae bacterium]
YCERIGYTGPLEPTPELLASLVRWHMATIPFEAIDVLLGRGVELAPQAIDRKLLTHRRGGYCQEHASLMRRVLQAIGFMVEQHLARVWVGRDPSSAAPGAPTHTSLQVALGDARWLVDVGFGGFTPTEPLVWRLDEPQQTAFGSYRLTRTRDGRMLESWQHNQWAPLYEILDFHWQAADFKIANHYTATHPDSHFRHDLMVALTKPHGRTTLAGNRLRRVALDGTRTQERLDADGLAATLDAVFGLPVADDWQPLLRRVAAATAED